MAAGVILSTHSKPELAGVCAVAYPLWASIYWRLTELPSRSKLCREHGSGLVPTSARSGCEQWRWATFREDVRIVVELRRRSLGLGVRR